MSDKYQPEPDVWPKSGGSATGKDYAYSVEARFAYYEPKQFGPILLDRNWRRINFRPSSVGVPTGRKFGMFSDLLDYEAAQALRWWFLADANGTGLGTLCVETRIVKHEINYSFREEAVGAEQPETYRTRGIP